MKFTVLWTLAAEDELAEIWLSADDRAAVTNAADEIDHRLRIDPINEGESRESGRRILLLSPLGVIFEVSLDDRIVRVLHVRPFGKRN